MGSIYAIGGSDNISCLRFIEKFNKVENKWEKLRAILIRPRCHHQAIAHKDLVFIIGGTSDFRDEKSIEKFNTSSGQVTMIKAKLRKARYNFVAFKLDNYVHIVGGNSSAIASFGEGFYTTTIVEIFNLETETVERGVEFLGIYSGQTSCVGTNLALRKYQYLIIELK